MDRARIGEMVRTRRAALKLSLRRAAELSGGTVAHSTWGQVEIGMMNVTVDMLADIARTLHCRWQVRLVPEGAESTVRAELIDRLAAIVDLIEDRDARVLMSQVREYERELGLDVEE